MTEILTKLAEYIDITKKNPDNDGYIGGDIFIYQLDDSAVKEIAFRRGCERIPSSCTLFKDGKCSATNIVTKRLLNRSINVEEEGTVGPHQILCGEGMDHAGILTLAAEVFTGFREEVEKQLSDMLKMRIKKYRE